ncbi:helix-turn-helix domain-containing protein [Thalassotalea sp. ND16A]|uniref:helix-turn-helix domain-containing protein n=1 Tax=Thalassotalea sp. ND16A TaxID=1535422 RepID=UPI00051E129B|nr:helix-turn-helix transcriptional regulator [Thalassotalea sp. ND16A]KGJ93497.1 putative transcriptional regulator, XRE family [Thalassotalea sp. ND16A]
MELPDKLVQLRKEWGWTQAIAAKKIAIQQSYLSKLESGQYQPSEEVINKICSAYKIKSEDLLSRSKKNRNVHYAVIISAIIGLLFLLSGYLSLFFPQTYYTYKAKNIENQKFQGQVNINYHVTDHYQGEKYIQSFENRNYEYSLVAQRDISRAENRWFIAFGCLFIFLPISASIYKFKILRK